MTFKEFSPLPVANIDDLEGLYFDSHFTGDTAFAALLVHSGFPCVRTIARGQGAAAARQKEAA
jgi:hypothetical protein